MHVCLWAGFDKHAPVISRRIRLIEIRDTELRTCSRLQISGGSRISIISNHISGGSILVRLGVGSVVEDQCWTLYILRRALLSPRVARLCRCLYLSMVRFWFEYSDIHHLYQTYRSISTRARRFESIFPSSHSSLRFTHCIYARVPPNPQKSNLPDLSIVQPV